MDGEQGANAIRCLGWAPCRDTAQALAIMRAATALKMALVGSLPVAPSRS
jgi:hypothetical protein